MDRGGECREGKGTERAFLCGVDSFFFGDVRGGLFCFLLLEVELLEERWVRRDRKGGREGKAPLKSSGWKVSACGDYCSVLGGSVVEEGVGSSLLPILLHADHLKKRNILALS